MDFYPPKKPLPGAVLSFKELSIAVFILLNDQLYNTLVEESSSLENFSLKRNAARKRLNR
jgi:hypothetical protein